MTSEQFIFWLQGYFELADPKNLTEEQVEIIKNHLKLVFFYEIDPSYSDDPKTQVKMQSLHDGKGRRNEVVKC